MVAKTGDSLLRGKREQDKDVNPQAGHRMPVPGGDVDDNSARFHGTMQNNGGVRDQKRYDAAHQMKSMHSGEHVDEGTAGAAGEVKSSGRELVPNQKLSGKK